MCVASGRLKRGIIIGSDELSRLYIRCHRGKWGGRELLLLWPCWLLRSDAVSTVIFFCSSSPHGWILPGSGASRKAELANIFLCHLVWSGTDSACSLSPKLLPQVSSLVWRWFHSDFSAAQDVWPIVLASVSKCFWQVLVKDRLQG